MDVLTDILIPVLAIYIPTRLAVRLAKAERLAADAARIEDRRLDAEARAEDRRLAVEARDEDRRLVKEARDEDRRLEQEEDRERQRQAGGAAALEAMEQLLRVAQEREDFKQRELLVPMRSLLLEMGLKLRPHHAVVNRWALADINAVLQVTDVRDDDGRPLHMEEIQDRHSAFSIRISQWRLGRTPDAWFEGREVKPLGEPPM
ncbi:hypothetical protein DZF98_01235 [Clavibacter californiensis]|uniref:Uncharacterized protein n=1 Tax=Clavibacter californiensis TaxID=1401995 RepID=A0ABX9NC39_9MICO|nr:hypothetical protein DZF98_01235 [Clavibacter californiensis]